MFIAYVILFGVLFCSVFIWLFLCARLFKILETRHPEKYVAMGRPALIRSESFSSNFAFVKFLFKKEWQALNDVELASLGRFMLIFICIFFAGFVFLLLLPFVWRYL